MIQRLVIRTADVCRCAWLHCCMGLYMYHSPVGILHLNKVSAQVVKYQVATQSKELEETTEVQVFTLRCELKLGRDSLNKTERLCFLSLHCRVGDVVRAVYCVLPESVVVVGCV